MCSVATSNTHSHFPIDSISPTSPLTPSAPLPSFSIHPTSQSRSTCLTVSISPTSSCYHSSPKKSTHPSIQPPPLTNNKALNKPLTSKSISSTSPKPCKCYMQWHCHYGKKALVALIHILQCVSSSLRVVIKDVPRGGSCKYAHPKICCSYLLYHKCDRVKCYFYHATGTVRPNFNQDLPRNTGPKRSGFDPTPLMHIRFPPPPCHHLTP